LFRRSIHTRKQNLLLTLAGIKKSAYYFVVTDIFLLKKYDSGSDKLKTCRSAGFLRLSAQ